MKPAADLPTIAVASFAGESHRAEDAWISTALGDMLTTALALLWVAITLSLNALIVPLSVSGLEAVPVWQILSSRSLRVAWGAGLGLLSTAGLGAGGNLRDAPARPY